MRKTLIFICILLGTFCLAPSSSVADDLNELKSGSSGELSFELRPLPGTVAGQIGVELSLTTGKTALPDPEVTTLSNPTRVVIDLAGVKTNSKSIKIDSYGVTALRFGRHPERARVVLDLAGEKEVRYRITHSDDKRSITVTISHTVPGGSTASIPEVQPSTDDSSASVSSGVLSSAASSSAEPTAVSTAASLGAPEILKAERSKIVNQSAARSSASASVPAKVSSKPAEESVPVGEEFGGAESQEVSQSSSSSSAATLGSLASVAPVTKSSSSAWSAAWASASSASSSIAAPVAASTVAGGAVGQAAGGDSVIRGLSFQKNERGTGVVIIDVSHLSHYSVTRAQDNVFEVVIDDAHLGGAHLELPQFPPDFFEGLEVVRAHNRGRNVIELFVEDAIKVTPYASKGQLYIGLGY